MTTIIIFILIAYLLGSLSSAVIVCKIMRLPDPRTQGSGNPGTSNVLRIGGKTAALFVLLGDVLKGLVPVVIARYAFNIDGFSLGLIAVAAILGHIFPIFFKFKGGKGVATYFGAILPMSPIIGICSIITWFVTAYLARYSSLASLLAVIFSIMFAFLIKNYSYIIPLIIISGLVIWRHKGNIERLKTGNERLLKF